MSINISLIKELMVYPNDGVLCSHYKEGKSIFPYIKQSLTNEMNFHYCLGCRKPQGNTVTAIIIRHIIYKIKHFNPSESSEIVRQPGELHSIITSLFKER